MAAKKINNSPAESYKRDSNGLLENVQYIFNDDGSVNWRAMIKDEHLYPNKEAFLRFNKEVPKSIEGLKDNQLLITLGGIKELLKLRGFLSMEPKIIESGEERAVCSCEISFIANYETDGHVVDYAEVANATLDNTDGFSAKFLECIAANRAFVRCVRNFLNVHIVGADEIDKSDPDEVAERKQKTVSRSSSPDGVLEKCARDHDINSFEEFKDFLREMWVEKVYINEEVKSWEAYSDIPAKEARTLLAVLKKNKQ